MLTRSVVISSPVFVLTELICPAMCAMYVWQMVLFVESSLVPHWHWASELTMSRDLGWRPEPCVPPSVLIDPVLSFHEGIEWKHGVFERLASNLVDWALVSSVWNYTASWGTSMTPYIWAERNRRFWMDVFDMWNKCKFDSYSKLLGTSCLHELHESKLPFVPRIEFIHSKLS